MPTLFSWSLQAHGDKFFAHGVASERPRPVWERRRPVEGRYIRTSSVWNITQEGNYLTLETASCSVYLLAMEELDRAAGTEFPLPPPEELGLPSDFWERCVRAREYAAKKEEEDALRTLKAPGTLRLRIVGATVLSAFWSGADGTVCPLPAGIHGGMFQDSVLVGGPLADTSKASRVDFRYFPYDYPWYYERHNRIEPYKISSGIETIQILNEGFHDVEFGYTENTVLCTAGETTLIAVGSTVGKEKPTLKRL